MAMGGTQEYVESLVSSRIMRDKGQVTLSEESGHEITQLLLEGF